VGDEIKIKKMGWVCSTKTRKEYKTIVRKSEVKNHLKRPRRRWENNQREGVRMCNGFIWLRIRSSGEVLCMR
jgi:hypothetical protein